MFQVPSFLLTPHASCPGSCKNLIDLRKHLHTHSEEPAFRCDFENCTFSARSLCSIKSHCRKVHEVSGAGGGERAIRSAGEPRGEAGLTLPPLSIRETQSQGTDAMCVTNASQGATTSLCTFARSTSSSGPLGTPVFGMSLNAPPPDSHTFFSCLSTI